MNDDLSRRAFVRRAAAAGVATGVAVGTTASATTAAAQDGTDENGTTTDSEGEGTAPGGEGGEGDGADESEGEEFTLGRDLQVIAAAVVVAVLSPLVFAALLLGLGKRGSDRDRDE